MFSESQALQIRQGLAELDFSKSLPQGQRSVFEQYFGFYDFDSSLSAEAVFHTAGCNSIAGFEIVSQYFRPRDTEVKGTVVLLHGYLDHSGLYSHAIRFCLSKGYAALVFDMPGHGLSSGLPASIQSFDQYSDVLLELLITMKNQGLKGPWHMIGQSTGAAVMIDCLLKERFSKDFPLVKFIALAPLLRPYAWQTSKYLFALSRPFLRSTKRKFSENSHDQRFLDFLKLKDPLQSKRLQRDWILAMLRYQQEFAEAEQSSANLHIVQGTGDTTVDWQFNLEKFAEKFTAVQIEKIEGARHHLVNESEAYRKQMFNLVAQALAA